MADFGDTTLHAVLLLATWSGALALVGGRRGSPRLVHAARLALYATASMASLAVVVLAYEFVVSDFSLTYVHRYSDRTIPLFYKLTSVWGGQEGSLLLWVWLLAAMGAAAVHTTRERLQELLPHVLTVLSAVLVFFCVVMLLASNPFETYLVDQPTTGKGLNPLLQNPYMVFHPPALYVGYVGMTIPFVFAVAALLAGTGDARWVRAARPWALASWYFLSLGLVLGMLWAYEELGWGGYWGWDPVENAGLIPWLTATALIHTIKIQERCGMLRVLNPLLAILTFELTIFGTFLTRSGFIESVHAFARSSIGWYFLGFLALVSVVSAVLLVWRRRSLRAEQPITALLSREFSFVVLAWLLVAAAALVLVLTIFPSLSVLFGDKVTINPAAFNRWITPIGLALLLLKGAGPELRWRSSSGQSLLRALLLPAVLGALTAAALWLAGLRHVLSLATIGLVAFVVGAILLDVHRGAALRARAAPGRGYLSGLGGVLSRGRRRYGGLVVHLGMALMYLGFAGDAYKVEREVIMERGARRDVGGYTLRYDGAERSMDAQKQMTTATLSVFRDGRHVGVVRPAHWVYFKQPDQPTSEVDIRRSVGEDLFVVLAALDRIGRSATFKVVINPLVSWIWLGFLLLTLGTVVALLPAPRPLRLRAARAGEEAGA